MPTSLPGIPPQSDPDPAPKRITVLPDADVQRATLPAITPDTPPPDRSAVLRFGSGRSLVATEEGGEEQIEIRAAGGALLLSMRLTEAGPVLSLSAASLEIAATNKLSLRAETLELSAAKDISVRSERGGISMRANDDVDIVGERVRLNSDDPPMPETWEEHRGRHALILEPVCAEPASSGEVDGT